MSVVAFTIGSFGDILATLQLIINVSGTLRSNHDVERQCQNLLLELQSLFPILSLMQSFLNDYQHTSIGETLTHVIRPQLAQCHLDLAQCNTEIGDLNSNSWSAVWKRVVWAGSSKANILSQKLFTIRCSLTSNLVALLALGFLEGSHPGVRLIRGQANDSNRLGPLRMVQEKVVHVLDPLGTVIPIPIIFCASWETFHSIIERYSKDRAGSSYIERGDYELFRQDDNKVLNNKSFRDALTAGDKLEISIIVNSGRTALCPRCDSFNFSIDGSWKICRYCNVQVKFTELEKREQSSSSSMATQSLIAPLKIGAIDAALSKDDIFFFRRVTLTTYSLPKSTLIEDSMELLRNNFFGRILNNDFK